jgi:hypothetical protein
MSLDKYKPATDQDFDDFRRKCEDEQGWDVYHKTETTIVTKKSTTTDAIYPVRVAVIFPDLSPETLYDILHDHEYRATWDPNMIEGKVLYQLDPRNEIGYYAAKCPPPIASRDFLNQRSWRARPEQREWIIMNHSIEHPDHPEKKGLVRAQSILTGYFILRRAEGGSKFIYYSQSDPKGWIPSWVINSLLTSFAPKAVEKLYEAAVGYKNWKPQHNPEHKPWLQS